MILTCGMDPFPGGRPPRSRKNELADKPITIHDLRRTYITQLIRGGASLPTVQQLAGHATVTTTVEFYNEVNDSDLREAVAKKRRASAG